MTWRGQSRGRGGGAGRGTFGKAFRKGHGEGDHVDYTQASTRGRLTSSGGAPKDRWTTADRVANLEEGADFIAAGLLEKFRALRVEAGKEQGSAVLQKSLRSLEEAQFEERRRQRDLSS